MGLAAGECDVIDWDTIHKSTVLAKSGLSLPVGQMLHLSIRAFNNVMMNCTRTSNPFVVDETPPNFTTSPTFDMTGVGLRENRQMDRSQVNDMNVILVHLYTLLKAHPS